MENEKKTINSDRDLEDSELDPIATHQELLITEIESADGHLGTALRSVFNESQADKFLERIDARIKFHDKEIERMCNYHYQGFIESIRGLLQVGTDVEKLKSEIQVTNSKLQESGKSLENKANQLIKARKVQQNISQCIDSLTVCLPVLEMYGKLRDQMKEKRYYPALKTLEQLEHTYLPRVSNYRFAQVMFESVPMLRDNIKNASRSDLKDFLENIRKHSDKIGEAAMKHAAEQNNMDVNLAISKSKKKRAPAPPNPFTGETEISSVDDSDTEFVSAQDMVDFSPVYRCLHIHSVLGARDTFETNYRIERKKQAWLALQPPPNMDPSKSKSGSAAYQEQPLSETLEAYKKYFHDIVGFFVIEDHILNTTNGLIDRSYLDERWDNALGKVVSVLRTHSSTCKDPNFMLQIKNLIMLFSHTLRGYGFTVSHLYDLLLEVRDSYSVLLRKRWIEIFNKIFSEDNYTPIQVENEEEYKKVTANYPFNNTLSSHDESNAYPRSFPFSKFVPKIYGEVKEYIYACLKFSEDLHLSRSEKDDMIRKLANVLLTQTLSGCLSELIKKPDLSLLQLIQISINTNYLEQSCVYLESFISNITGSEKESAHVSRLQGISMFKDSRSEAETQIYKNINDRVDEFFELASYDWLSLEPGTEASDFIVDMITFLRSTFLSFTNLPEKVAQTACMSACKHISSRIMALLCDSEIKSISMAFLQQINLDIKECEEFASSEPVPGFNDGTLQLAFTDLRQLVDLFIYEDWSTYLADFGQHQNKYLRVDPNNATILLEKLKESDKKKNNLFTNLKRNERDRKKLLETVLKQLKQLTNSQTTQS